MAIQFARCEYVSRSTGGNACRKASYNQRETISCETTGQVFSFKERGGNLHHEILLPQGADDKFKNSEVLWNEAERCEKRKDSQVAKEFVIALPDDAQVTLEDRIELTRRFATIFVEKGVAVQFDIHSPHDGEKNSHAHLLTATRRFSEDGKSFHAAKARDLDPVIRSRIVVEADVWGEIWKDLQDAYFEEKGYDLSVDPIGIISQEHLGPVRMRHHMNEAILRSQMLVRANEKLVQDPSSVIETVTRNRAVFTKSDIEFFLQKFIPAEAGTQEFFENILNHPTILPLYDKETGKRTNYFTTKEVRAEEEKLLRFADSIANKDASILHPAFVKKGIIGKSLSAEQREAYNLCVGSENNLVIIQGRAGVGKSYVLESIRMAHEAGSYRVLGLTPTHKIAADLRSKGFKEAKTCHAFLFAFKNNRETLNSNTLIVVDEAGMLGTELVVELFHAIKTSGAKLVLVGDDRQLNSVERGGAFGLLATRYEAIELKQVRRQTIHWQKKVSEELSQGDVRGAVHILQENKAVHWNATKEESLSELLKAWAKDNFLNPHDIQQILAQKNVDVDALNQGAREILRQQGRLGDIELTCMTQRGKMIFAEGDRIQLTETDKDQGLKSGYFGIIEGINRKTKKLTICLDNKEKIEVDPHSYSGLRHGYAATVYKAQGTTLDRVYVLHSNTINRLVNYVALTRQTKSLALYVSKDETPSEEHLIRQIGREEGKGTSLHFDTQQDIQRKQDEKLISTHIKHGAEAMVTKVKDYFHKNEDFYKVEKTSLQGEGEVSLSIYKPLEKMNKGELETLSHDSLSRLPQKNNEKLSSSPRSTFIDVKEVETAIKQNMAEFADDIFSSLGEPHHRSSSSATQRRYGKNGHIAVNLRTGAWIDHKDNEMSGGPLQMLMKLKGMSFKEAIEYGASWAGLSWAGIDHDLERVKSLAPRVSEKESLKTEVEENKTRIDKAQALWANGHSIKGTVAERYLKEHRNIEGVSSRDLRFLPSFKVYPHENGEPEMYNSDKSYPCLMAAARSPKGEITAVQLTYLDGETAAKADLPVQKKSFGVLKGSFVTLREGKSSDPIFVAEGVETALSLKEAGFMGTIKASLGLANIKRLEQRNLHIPIVICADHDAPDSPATRSLEKSIDALQEKGLSVTVIKPNNLHEDFNDVLRKEGPQGVQACLNSYTQKQAHALQTHEVDKGTQAGILESDKPNSIQTISKYLEDKIKEIKTFDGSFIADQAREELRNYMKSLHKDETLFKEIKAHNPEIAKETQKLFQSQTLYKDREIDM